MIGFGLLGCGRIAKRHADILSKSGMAGARLVAVCDCVPEAASKFSATYGVPAMPNLAALLAMKEIDAVSILTPSGLHAEHAIAVAKAGKHVIVEKPMALRLEDADAMIRACDETGVKMFVVKQNRFNVPIVKAREALQEGRFGRLVLGTVRVRWCRPQAYYDQATWRGTW
ncbi:MAG: Gfo/Idh/MocA family protein, partial [Steroidobacteraceae bacterium]